MTGTCQNPGSLLGAPYSCRLPAASTQGRKVTPADKWHGAAGSTASGRTCCAPDAIWDASYSMPCHIATCISTVRRASCMHRVFHGHDAFARRGCLMQVNLDSKANSQWELGHAAGQGGATSFGLSCRLFGPACCMCLPYAPSCRHTQEEVVVGRMGSGSLARGHVSTSSPGAIRASGP